MIEVTFEIGGRKIRLNQIKDALERAMFEQIREGLIKRIGNIRDPETNAVPKLRVKGRSLENFSIEVEGSPYLIEQVKHRLG